MTDMCQPLDYHTKLNKFSCSVLLGFCWIPPFVYMIVLLVLSNRLKLCKYHINKLYCDNWSMVKLSCESIVINNIYGFFCNFILFLLDCFCYFVIYKNYHCMQSIIRVQTEILADMCASYVYSDELCCCCVFWCHVQQIWLKQCLRESATFFGSRDAYCATSCQSSNLWVKTPWSTQKNLEIFC